MYLQPNISIIETIEVIKEKINNKTPFCLTRFGDGEIHLLNRNGSHRLHYKSYGYTLDNINEFYDDAYDILIKGLSKSDIIGIMDKNCEIISSSIYSDEVWSIHNDFIKNIGVDPKELVICDHMIARNNLLGNIFEFKEILNGNDLHIISPNKKLLKDKKLSEILECNVNITEHPYSINLNNRDELIRSFDNIQENVVLLGCGIQKDYGVILRDEYGKIALDMGATMDAWAGIISRPWFNKNNKQDYLII